MAKETKLTAVKQDAPAIAARRSIKGLDTKITGVFGEDLLISGQPGSVWTLRTALVSLLGNSRAEPTKAMRIRELMVRIMAADADITLELSDFAIVDEVAKKNEMQMTVNMYAQVCVLLNWKE